MLHKKIFVSDKRNGEKGLFAKDNIKKGEIVWKIDVGEKIISKSERDSLPSGIVKFAFQYNDGYVVVRDGSQYMNHSCNPNLWWEGNDSLSALRSIKKGEEITYDYSSADVGDWVAGWKCLCGEKVCRKRITGKDCLDSDFQKRFEGHLPTWVERYIRNNTEQKTLRNR